MDTCLDRLGLNTFSVSYSVALKLNTSFKSPSKIELTRILRPRFG